MMTDFERALREVLASKFYLPSPQTKLPLDHELVTATVNRFLEKTPSRGTV